MMTLQQFIQQESVRTIAKELDVSTQSVNQWENLNTCPDPVHMHHLVRMSGGKLKYEGIIEPYVKNRKARK